MSSAASKVAPKTLNQFRNFSYVVVAWLGFHRGYVEKRDNDAAWVNHQQSILKENASRHQAAVALRKAQEKAGKPEVIPALVPEDLHDLYREVSKSIQ